MSGEGGGCVGWMRFFLFGRQPDSNVDAAHLFACLCCFEDDDIGLRLNVQHSLHACCLAFWFL